MHLWHGITYANVWDFPLIVWQQFAAETDAYIAARNKGDGHG